MRLGHAHLKVRDLDRSVAFYTGAVGMRVIERIGDEFVFLSFGEAHHDLALQSVGEDAVTPPRRATGLFHLAFEVAGEADLRDILGRLREAELPAVGVDYGISRAVYTHDPDGHGVEFYRDTRAETGRELWRGESRPLAV